MAEQHVLSSLLPGYEELRWCSPSLIFPYFLQLSCKRDSQKRGQSKIVVVKARKKVQRSRVFFQKEKKIDN